MTRYLILTKYDDTLDAPPMTEWNPGDASALMEFLRALNQELIESGELIDAQALTGPDLVKIVISDGKGSTAVTDGPFAEVKELLAGYQMIDVESADRALEIAARLSAAPGPDGVPLRQKIEVRQVMGRPPGADL